MSKQVSLVVVTGSEGQMLLVRSARRRHRWELPGGAWEQGERAEQAAVREVHEETGITLRDLRLVGTYTGKGDGVVRTVFAAGTKTAPAALPPDQAEIVEIEWFDPEDLPHPMPILSLQMIADTEAHIAPVEREVEDDGELI